VVVPGVTPVTLAEAALNGFTVAMAVDAMLHEPPETALNTVMLWPIHIGALPTIGPGEVFTVTVTYDLQPEGVCVYVIISVPIAIPLTTPVGVTLATVAGIALNVPGPVVELSTVVVPTHSVRVPVGMAGAAMIVMGSVRTQPLGEVSVTVAVPAERPVTTPDVELISARTPAKLMLHVPGSTSE
jgi:hypothetical protein